MQIDIDSDRTNAVLVSDKKYLSQPSMNQLCVVACEKDESVCSMDDYLVNKRVPKASQVGDGVLPPRAWKKASSRKENDSNKVSIMDSNCFKDTVLATTNGPQVSMDLKDLSHEWDIAYVQLTGDFL